MSWKKKYKKLLKAHKRFQDSNRDLNYKLLIVESENESLKAENKKLNQLLKEKSILN